MRCCLSTAGSPEYRLRVAHSTSVTTISPYTHRRFSTIYIEAAIELVWRCTWKPRSSELRDALGGRDRASLEMHLDAVIVRTWRLTRASLEMHLEAMIERVWRCNWGTRSSELSDALGGRDRSSLEMHLEAVIERVWRCTGRLWSSEFGDAIGDRDWVNLEIHSGAVIERVWGCTCSRLWWSEIGGVLGGGRFRGRRDGSWDSIHWLIEYNIRREMRDWLGTGDCPSWDDAVIGVNSWLWHGEIERDDLTSCS